MRGLRDADAVASDIPEPVAQAEPKSTSRAGSRHGFTQIGVGGIVLNQKEIEMRFI